MNYLSNQADREFERQYYDDIFFEDEHYEEKCLECDDEIQNILDFSGFRGNITFEMFAEIEEYCDLAKSIWQDSYPFLYEMMESDGSVSIFKENPNGSVDKCLYDDEGNDKGDIQVKGEKEGYLHILCEWVQNKRQANPNF
ncbi:MAG: hypothetical protein FWH23_02430 [Bacteroidales bacterium]|nr:hypothetical protein [Bacteroidales bacterium]MCL2132798.1 hypothetical protein [Bacteroidales bacterium]